MAAVETISDVQLSSLRFAILEPGIEAAELEPSNTEISI